MNKIKELVIHVLIFPIFLSIYLSLVLFKKRFKKDNPKDKPKLVWGPVPLINNKYWSNALKKAGFESMTLMSLYYSRIHKKEDFDLYTYELPGINKLPRFLIKFFLIYCVPYYSFLYSIVNFDIFHHHFDGGFLSSTPFWFLEASLLRRANCKSIITAYGSDAFRYSQVPDTSLRHVLISDYPLAAREETKIQKRVEYWVKNADIIIASFQVQGLGRWEVLCANMLTIDVSVWKMKKKYSNFNGRNGVVKILHSPNHRSAKGTEFIIEAANQLRSEGLKVELLLLEKMKNDQVKEYIQNADILADQLFVGYGLSAMEGMATGLPVLSNTAIPEYTVFKRFAYLDECPVVATNVENIKENLKILITKPGLRKKLGREGRKYVEKYHSDETAVYIFGSVYDKIWYNKDVDLINLFHPLKSKYNNSKAPIKPSLTSFRNTYR